MKTSLLLALLLGLLAGAAAPVAAARETSRPTGVIGIDSNQLHADYWVDRQRHADRVVLDRAAIALQNRKLLQTDPSMHDIETLPTTLDAARVREWIESLSSRPDRTLYDESGKTLSKKTLDGLMAALDLKSIPETQSTRFGLVVHRADLRTFPTAMRVFNRTGDTDIDRFQESALFPGTPVAIVHESHDGKWWFVVSRRYAAWIEKQYVAEGSKTEVFAYTRKVPFLVVTGATERTTFTPDLPAVSELQLDMGVRVPVLTEWPGARTVNGQAAYTAHVIELPVRNDDGSLRIVPALLPRTADVAADYLPLTRANIITQAFKFLGERYGWGHSYGTRDCSGFVSEVYRSFGVQLPRNTSAQSVSPALNRLAFSPSDDSEKRTAAMRELQVGDLVYIPGHVMMAIGHDNGMPYVIHDTNGGSWLGADGQMVSGHLNGVSVTPLTPLRFSPTRTYVDRITNIQRIRP